ncbi:MAG TPA: SBBP repeat-containing protein [Pyrinomonadaceae bacterium]
MRSSNNCVNRSLSRALFVLCALSLLIASVALTRPDAPSPARGGASVETPLTTKAVSETYGQIPLSFEANRGQTDESVNFLARGAGYTLFLKPTEAVFTLTRRGGAPGAVSAEQSMPDASTPTARNVGAPDTAGTERPAVLRMKLVGADARASVEGAEELAGRVNYFNGNDPAKWRTDVPTFGRVRYPEVYPGIDVVYYGNQRQLEYDFVVAPGVDARSIALEFDGADKLEVDAAGDLLLTLGEEVIRQPKPLVYQEVAGARREVAGGYALEEGGRVRFALGEYDARLPLVIDPVLVYSTYLGGSNTDLARAIAVDSSGRAYVTGYTNSTNFPTANAFQASLNGTAGAFGNRDVFVTKLNAEGTAFVYSTYLGGSGGEEARGIAVDSLGSAYVAGFTSSTNFPIANAIQATKGATNEDAFVTKLNADGTALVYSTYLGGGESSEFGEAIAVDSSGAAYVTGSTFSDDFPTLNPIQATFGGGSTDAFVTKINADGTALVYSTYLGGSGSPGSTQPETGFGIAADSAGNAYVTGETNSANFPVANAVQGTFGGGISDAFVAKISATGNAFVYSTFLGGGAQDAGEGVKADASGNTYVAGFTVSTNFPVANALQGANAGGQDAFVTKLNANGSTLVYSTYFGGTGGEIAFGIAIDASGSVYLGGSTGSTNTLPTANAIQCTRNGGQDTFIAKFNATASALVYSTYLGGSGSDDGQGIALDPSNNAYLTGSTTSTDFPTVNPIQSANAGGSPFGDAFVTKVSDNTTGPASQLQFTQTAPSVQEDVTSLTLTVQRIGDTAGPVTVDYATADGTASERSDYTTALGTLSFAAGESAKNVVLLINEDSKVEGNETFTVTLSNPTGGGTLSCLTATATVQITDDTSEPATNVIDDASIFVGQHYHDFLNRQSDPAGQAFWTEQLTACGADAACIDERRQNVSAAFFLSIEFQRTGYEVIRIYKATFTDSPGRPRGLPRYREFLRDTQEVARGIVVGHGPWEQQLDDQPLAFARRWVQTTEFVAQFPLGTPAGQYVDKLFLNSEVTPTTAERDAAIAAYGAGDTEGRAQALLSVTRSNSVYNRQYNPAFVLMQYIGYLRRNPNDAPDASYAGYDFWLTKLNQFSVAGEDVVNENVALGRVRRAEMVRAFIISGEYRGRFGP